jgi:hypothetical protein
METIKKNDKFVACWGYDQTQYSIYNVVETKGKSVLVEGLNGWSNLDANDLAAGSKVKVYQKRNERFHALTEEERQAIAKEFNFSLRTNDFVDFEFMMTWHNQKLLKAAPVQTIVKMNRVDGQKWTYLWVLDDGQVINSTEDWQTRPTVHIVHGMKKCLVQTSKYNGEKYIKIDDVITAHFDPDFNHRLQREIELGKPHLRQRIQARERHKTSIRTVSSL